MVNPNYIVDALDGNILSSPEAVQRAREFAYWQAMTGLTSRMPFGFLQAINANRGLQNIAATERRAQRVGASALGNVFSPYTSGGQVPQNRVDGGGNITTGSLQQPQTFVDAIKGFEGFNPKAYKDYKQYSIGYGTRANSPDEVIDQKEADIRLNTELGKATELVDAFGAKYGLKLDPGTRYALASLTYNTGADWMNSGLGQAIRSGDTNRAKQLFAQYTMAGGAYSPGLAKRRQQELQWYGNPNAFASGAARPQANNDTGNYVEGPGNRRYALDDNGDLASRNGNNQRMLLGGPDTSHTSDNSSNLPGPQVSPQESAQAWGGNVAQNGPNLPAGGNLGIRDTQLPTEALRGAPARNLGPTPGSNIGVAGGQQGLPTPIGSPTGQITRQQLEGILANPWIDNAIKNNILTLIQQRAQPQVMDLPGYGKLQYNPMNPSQNQFFATPHFGKIKLGDQEVETVSIFNKDTGQLETRLLNPGGRTGSTKAAQATGEVNPNDEYEPDFSSLGGMRRSQIHVDQAKAVSQKLAEGQAALVNEAITQSIASAKLIPTLDTIAALSKVGGTTISRGPTSEWMTAYKQLMQNMGLGSYSELPLQEGISKLNSVLAGQAARALGSRATNFDLELFLRNNPSLHNSEAGLAMLASLLKQEHKKNVEIGKMASNMASTPSDVFNFTQKVNDYNQKHPLIVDIPDTKDQNGKIIPGKRFTTQQVVSKKELSAQLGRAATVKDLPDGTIFVEDLPKDIGFIAPDGSLVRRK